MTMRFKQGDIILFDFPKEKSSPQYTIHGVHPALVLHDYTLPNKTMIISPISSLYHPDGTKKELKSYHLPLYKKDYKLKYDSYVKLDQIMSFSRHLANGSYIDTLNERDKAKVHLKLIETLQMQDTISEIVTKQIEQTVNQILEEHLVKILDRYEGN